MITPLKIQIRFSDCDLMGHINNACYLNYFESTRLHYFAGLVGEKWDWKSHGIILRKNTVEYLAPVFLHESPEIKLLLKEIGTKSFTLAYELRVDEQIRTTGESIIVCFDFDDHRSIEIPAELKNALLKLEKYIP